MTIREKIIDLYTIRNECMRDGNYISADRIASIIEKLERLEV